MQTIVFNDIFTAREFIRRSTKLGWACCSEPFWIESQSDDGIRKRGWGVATDRPC